MQHLTQIFRYSALIKIKKVCIVEKFTISDIPFYKYESLEQLGTKRNFGFEMMLMAN